MEEKSQEMWKRESLPLDNPYRMQLIDLVRAIGEEIQIKTQDLVLIVMSLDTEAKILQFEDWIEDKLVDGKLTAKATEITRAAVRIDKENQSIH